MGFPHSLVLGSRQDGVAGRARGEPGAGSGGGQRTD